MFRFGDPGGRIYTSVGTSNVNLLAHWTNVSGSSLTVSSSNGRTTGSCLRWTGHSAYVEKVLDAQQIWGVAFAYRMASLPTGGSQVILQLLDVSSALQIDLRINTDGTITVTRNTTTLSTSSAGVVSANTWIHFELKVKIDPSVGTIEVRKNGVAVIGPLTSQNTRATANSTALAIRMGPSANIGTTGTEQYDFDDIIIWDAQTTDANGFTDISNFISDCGLVWLLPTGAGATTQFTPDTGSNYARVNESTPDGDTSYVSDATIGHIDTYAMANLSGTAATVKSIASILYARKDDVGSRGIKSELRSGGGNTAHTTEISLSNSYQYYFENWGQDPNNGSATNWTPTTVNALEAGQTVSS